MNPMVDIHTHLAPRLDERARARHHIRAESQRYLSDGKPIGIPGLYDAPALSDWLAHRHIDVAVVSPPPPFFRSGLDAAATARWVGDLNDGLLARVEGHPSLTVAAYLPLDRPRTALVEAERWLAAGHPAHFSGSAGGAAVPLDNPELTPLWELLDARSAFLLLHPGSSPDRRLDPYYLANLLGNPVETTLAAAQLVFGGVLDRFPAIGFTLVHCGGAVSQLLGRWQRGHDTARPGVDTALTPPVEAVRRLHTDALAHDPRVISLACEVFGTDRVLLGSDWPFAMGLDDPLEAVAHLPEADRELIGRTNPARLLGLPGVDGS